MKIVLLWIVAGIAALVIVTGLVFWVGWLQLPWQNLQTRAIHNSNQYVITMQDKLSEKYQAWLDLDTKAMATDDPAITEGYKAQKAVLVRQMATIARTIDAQYVPPEVSALIAGQQ